ncbi:protein of unknown function [Micropruina glycogenica]|uniref:Uncharacterized protein n=1 Tax=Micropruina glycogenica TaxID=75385 RepID=A0A2N9JE44_9ACTN|nr:protein of unknown function [Micropruina glycogenica]
MLQPLSSFEILARGGGKPAVSKFN